MVVLLVITLLNIGLSFAVEFNGDIDDLNCPYEPCLPRQYCSVFHENSLHSGRQCEPCTECSGNQNINLYEIRKCAPFHNTLCCQNPKATAVYEREIGEYVCEPEETKVKSEDNDYSADDSMINSGRDDLMCKCPNGKFCRWIYAPANKYMCYPCSKCADDSVETQPCTILQDTLCGPSKVENEKDGMETNPEIACNDKSCSIGHFCKKGTPPGASACQQCSRCTENTIETQACAGYTDTVCSSKDKAPTPDGKNQEDNSSFWSRPLSEKLYMLFIAMAAIVAGLFLFCGGLGRIRPPPLFPIWDK